LRPWFSPGLPFSVGLATLPHDLVAEIKNLLGSCRAGVECFDPLLAARPSSPRGFRPVALRPWLSPGLPFSRFAKEVLTYLNSTLFPGSFADRYIQIYQPAETNSRMW